MQQLSHQLIRSRTLLALLAGVLIGALTLGVVWSMSGGGNEARVALRTHADGRVEVALQAHTGDGWSARQLPTQRFLYPAGATPGDWIVSSAVDLPGGMLDGPIAVEGAHALGPWQFPNHLIAAANRPLAADTLFCIIAHGSESDSFWRILFEAASTSSLRYGIDVRASVHPESADQAAAVQACIDDGAAVVATTLADPDALRPVLLGAAGTGTRIVTFNSGINEANSVYSGAHIRLDEAAAGRLAAAQFNALGGAARAICVIHEAVNVGLQERCDAFAEAFAGSVEVLNIGSLAAAERAGAIAAAAGHDAVHILTLNYNTTAQAVAGLHALDHHHATVGAIGSNHPTLPAYVATGLVEFAIWDQPAQQGFLLPTAMLMVHGFPSDQQSGLITSVREIVIAPQLVTQETVENTQTEAYRAANPYLSRAFGDAILAVKVEYGLE